MQSKFSSWCGINVAITIQFHYDIADISSIMHVAHRKRHLCLFHVHTNIHSSVQLSIQFGLAYLMPHKGGEAAGFAAEFYE